MQCFVFLLSDVCMHACMTCMYVHHIYIYICIIYVYNTYLYIYKSIYIYYIYLYHIQLKYINDILVIYAYLMFLSNYFLYRSTIDLPPAVLIRQLGTTRPARPAQCLALAALIAALVAPLHWKL